MEQRSTQDIKTSIDQMRKLLPVVKNGLNEAEDKLQVIHNVTEQIEETLRHLSACQKAMKTLAQVATAMSAIPIIGSVANALSKVLKSAEKSLNTIQKSLVGLKDTAKTIDKAADAADKGLQTAIDTDDRLAEILPKVEKTLTVLDYLLQIADCLVPLVAGSSLADTLNKTRDKIDAIEQSAKLPITTMNDVLDDLCESLSKVKEQCDEIENKCRNLLVVINRLKAVAEVFSPIGNAFQRVINAIAPIKWVLKAAQCLIDKIFNPVIDAILKATGLSKLIDELEAKIINLLGFDDIIDEIKKAIGGDKIVADLKRIISFNINMPQILKDLDAAMQEFSPIRNVDLGNNLKCMLGELVGAEIDPTRPSVIPDWPEIDIADNAVLLTANHKRTVRFDWNARLQVKTSGLSSIFTGIGITPNTELRYQLCKDISQKSDAITKIFEETENRRQTLVSLVSTLEATLRLPDYFIIEMQSLHKCLEFLSHAVTFLSGITTSPIIHDKLGEMVKWINSQLAACDSVVAEINSLNSALPAYHEYSLSVLTAIHTEDVANMTNAVNSYAEALQRILDGFCLAAEHHPDADTTQKLCEARKRVIANGEDVLRMLSDLESAAKNVSQGYLMAHDRLKNTLAEFCKLSPEGYLLPEKTVNTLVKVSNWLAQVEGIFDPLSMLIEALKDDKYEATDDMDTVSPAMAILHDFSQHTTNMVEKNDIWTLLEIISPISLLGSQLHTFVTDSLSYDKTFLDTLSKHVQTMTCLLDEGCKYQYDDESITNKFIDCDDVNMLTEISYNIVEHKKK